MNRPEEHLLLRVAESVADESPVDWSREEALDAALMPRLESLRLIEQVAAAYRDASYTAPQGHGGAERPALFEWGHLRAVEKLGEGSFGEVYRAYDFLLDCDVALKLRRSGPSRPSDGGRGYIQEARRLARVRHPNVLAVHGADVHDGRVGLWTELIVGSTLECKLEADGPFGPHEACLVGLQLCRALAAVHAAGLVHGDLKASNVMRERGGRIVLMDFGAVTEASAGTADLAAVGTPLAMAPEVLKGEAPGPGSDLYSLGVLLYRLVSATYPVTADDLAALRARHERREHRSLRDQRPDLPLAFVQAVERALAVEPRDRFASAGAMERALAAAATPAAGSPESGPLEVFAPPAGTPASTPGGGSRTARWGWTAAALAVPAAALVLWLALGRGGEPTAEPSAGPAQAPAPAPGAEAPAAQASPVSVGATFFRETELGREALFPGGSVAPGDRLSLEVESAEWLHYYVLNQDQAGEVFSLFPLDGLDLANPLPPDQRHRLPGRYAGAPQHWEVTSAGGRERFLVAASRQRLDELERELAGLSAASPGQRLRGVSSLAAAEPVDEDTLERIFRRLEAERRAGAGLWLLRLELANPGPG